MGHKFFLWLFKAYSWLISWLVVLVSILSGVVSGLYLSKLENLEIFKLLNVTGLLYDILGVVILSRIILTNEKWQKFITYKFSRWFVYVQLQAVTGLTFFPFIILALSDTQLGEFFNLDFNIGEFPSYKVVTKFAVNLIIPATLLLFFIEDTVYRGVVKTLPTLEVRSRFLGYVLIILGFILQFIAAFQDLFIHS